MKAVQNRKLSVFQLGWLVRKGALNLPLTVQLLRAGLGFNIDGSTPQPVSAADSVSQTQDTSFADPPWIVVPVVGRLLLLV